MESAGTNQIGSPGPDTSTASEGAIQLTQLNLHRCVQAQITVGDRLTCWTSQDSTDLRTGWARAIALVQEPYLQNNKVKMFHNTNIYESSGSGNRACIITNKNITGITLTQFTNRDQAAVLFNLNGKDVILVSTYMANDERVRPVVLPPEKITKDVIKYAKDKGIGIIIGTDANSHNTAWGSTDINPRGIALLDYILDNQLMIANEIGKPTFVTKARSEVLDITIATPEIANKILGWHVSEYDSHSDHKYIDMILDFKPNINACIFRNIKKTNWLGYKTTLESKRNGRHRIDSDRIDIESLEIIANNLRDDIMDSYTENCRVSEKKGNEKPRWWGKKLEQS